MDNRAQSRFKSTQMHNKTFDKIAENDSEEDDENPKTSLYESFLNQQNNNQSKLNKIKVQ